jgi:hypothetical protein
MGCHQSTSKPSSSGTPRTIYNPADLQYMQNAQLDFTLGSYQPWMTNANQWVQNPEMVAPEQSALGVFPARWHAPSKPAASLLGADGWTNYGG